MSRKRPSLIDVVFPGSALQPLTYVCPTGVTPEATVGRRVVAIVRNRKAVGVVVSRRASAPRKRTPQPILELLDKRAVVTDELLKLALWLQQRYCCTLSQAIRCVLPTVPTIKREEVAILRAASPLEVALLLGDQHPLDAELLRYLEPRGRALRRSLPGREDRTAQDSALRRLRREGHVSLETREKVHLPHARVHSWVSLEMPGRSGAADVRVTSFLQSRGGRCSMETLREECGLSRSTVKRLVRTGTLSLHQPPHGAAEGLPALSDELTQAKHSLIRSPISGCSLVLRPPGLSLHHLWGHLAGHALSEGKSVLVLFPEVASAREAADRFERWFPGRSALLHGGMTPGQRENAWSRIGSGRTPLVVGTRSAVFAPLENVGLAIMDAEHDPAYKNEESPRYHARRVLLERARIWRSRAVLSSTTPCMESYHHALQGDYSRVEVPFKSAPAAELVDMTEPAQGTNSWHVSETLAAELRRVVGRQLCAVLVHNRRGYASFLVCKDCGLVPRCTRCDVPLVYHRRDKQMRCHHCGSAFGAPDTCTRCNGINLVPRGTGTERIETDVQRLVPSASVVCLEARRPAPDVEHANIVVATQAILRHVPWERVATVALLEAELSLGFPDFRAGERTFQLITALRDWSTRCSSPPRLIVQSRSPQTPCIQLACEGRYHDYAVEELAARRAVGYPPYQSLVRVEIASPHESEALRVAKNAGRRFSRIAKVLGPAPAPIPKLRGRFRYQLLVRSDPDTDLPHLVCRAAGRMRPPRGLRLIVDADPVSMM